MAATVPRICALLLALAVAGGHARAAVDPATEAVLLLRALAYDRMLGARAKEAVVVAVLHKAGDPASESAALAVSTALQAAAPRYTLAGLPVRIARVTFTDRGSLDAVVANQRIAALYVAPGLLDKVVDITGVSRSRSHGFLTLTGTETQLRAGLGLAVVDRNGRTTLVVNLPAVRAEGASFDAALLRLAEIIR